jgi:hypothetical protein
MIDTIALPNSTRTGERSITHRWLRPEVEVTDRDGGTRAVEVTIQHDKGSKSYTAHLSIIDVHAGYITAMISPYHGIRLHREPTARYSAKGLQSVNSFILGVLPSLVANEERVARLFSGQPLEGAR